MEEKEHDFSCPYCGSSISVLIDPSIPAQTYVEDCEVCCNPIELTYAFENGDLIAFDARSIEQ